MDRAPGNGSAADREAMRPSQPRDVSPNGYVKCQPTKGVSAMEYRLLGRSGLKVSALTLGTLTFGGEGRFARVGDTGVAEARRQVDMCLDAGVNMFDTSNVYSGGRAEEILGEVLEGRRERVLIASKGRARVGEGVNDSGLSRHYLIEQCENSLRRLRTDHIDLYQLHSWDGQTPLEETLGALHDLQRAGKIRYVGVSNFSGWHLMKMLMTSEREKLPRVISQQIYYSPHGREAEYELVPIALDQGVGILVWSPLAGGLLTGKYKRDGSGPDGARHMSAWGEPPVFDKDLLFDIVDVLVAVAAERNVSAAQVTLAYMLTKKGVASLVIGARTAEQLADNLAAADLQLSSEEVDRIDKVSQAPLIYPYWHQIRAATERLSAADLALLEPYLNSDLARRLKPS